MNRDLVKGMAIGVGATLLTPILLPVLARVGRPAVGAAMRAGMSAWERSREAFAELGEYAEDLAAEARSRRSSAPVPDEDTSAETPSNGHGTA